MSEPPSLSTRIAPGLTANALGVLRARYLRKDDRAQIVETPAQMFARVATHVAEVEARSGRGGDAAAAFADRLMQRMAWRATDVSRRLAQARGPYPDFVQSRDGTAGAPAVCNAPLFAVACTRHVLDGRELIEVNRRFEGLATHERMWSPELRAKMLESGHDQSSRGGDGVGRAGAYRHAFAFGCKGITGYRHGARAGQVLTTPGKSSVCPDCLTALEFSEGVTLCRSCGFSSTS